MDLPWSERDQQLDIRLVKDTERAYQRCLSARRFVLGLNDIAFKSKAYKPVALLDPRPVSE